MRPLSCREKFLLTSKDTSNGRTEILQKCRHKNKFFVCGMSKSKFSPVLFANGLF